MGLDAHCANKQSVLIIDVHISGVDCIIQHFKHDTFSSLAGTYGNFYFTHAHLRVSALFTD